MKNLNLKGKHMTKNGSEIDFHRQVCIYFLLILNRQRHKFLTMFMIFTNNHNFRNIH